MSIVMEQERPIALKILSGSLHRKAPKYMQAVKEQFETRHPEVQVIIDYVSDHYEMYKRMQEREADIVFVMEVDVNPLLSRGDVIDLMPLLERDPCLSPGDFYQGVLRGNMDGGRLAGLPAVNLLTPQIYYNKQRFDEAGLPRPTGTWTFGQFAEAAHKLTERDENGTIKRFGLFMGIDIENWEPYVMRNGGAYSSEDGSTVRGYADSEATVEAISIVASLYRERVASLPFEVQFNYKTLFSSGFAMIHELSYRTHQVLEAPDEWGVVGLPHMPGGVDTNMMYFASYGITSWSAHQELAWEFIREVTNPTNPELLDLFPDLPSNKKLAARLGMLDNPLYEPYLHDLERTSKSAFYNNQKWNASRHLINEDLRAMAEGKAQVRERLEHWANTIV
jgi:multiple sugar transport system substrate-binding protein